MDTVTKLLIGICIAFLTGIIIVMTSYLQSSSKKYTSKLKKRNEVDEEIEKELQKSNN